MVAGLVAISITRELGPLVAAIVVIGAAVGYGYYDIGLILATKHVTRNAKALLPELGPQVHVIAGDEFSELLTRYAIATRENGTFLPCNCATWVISHCFSGGGPGAVWHCTTQSS